MSVRKKAIVIGTAVVGVLGGAGGIAAATSTVTSSNDDKQLTGETLSRAVDAATSAVPGDVVDTEVGDDGAAYSVEIRRADGSVTEVHVDADFAVTGAEEDEEDDGLFGDDGGLFGGDDDGAFDD